MQGVESYQPALIGGPATETRKRILSIDGGGIKGVFPASFLAAAEESIGCGVADYFDLIVGTSTGGIIALALGLGFTASDILGFYERLGPDVFGTSAFGHVLAVAKQALTSKYGQKKLEGALSSLFGDRKLGDSVKRLVIPSFNLETGEVYVFKTRHHPRFERDHRVRAVDVALATAAAPTFFPTSRSGKGIPLIDGGVWANNPVGVAAVEAVGVLGWDLRDIAVLSLGCTSQPFSAGAARSRPAGLVQWAPRVTDLFMTAQSAGAMGIATTMFGHDRVLRFSPVMPRGRFGLDKLSEVPSLKGLGESEARKALPRLRQVFFDQPALPFAPYP